MRQTSFVLTAVGAVVGLATLVTALLFAWLGQGRQFTTSTDAIAGVLAAIGALMLVAAAIFGATQQRQHPRLSAVVLVVDAVVGFAFTGIMWIVPAALFLVAAALGLSGPKPRSARP